MRIAVVGAGAAGLTCSWLLDTDHDVVCYEVGARLGGNGRNEDIEVMGERVTVAPGATFLPPAMSPTALRLLREIGVPLERLSTQFTLCDERGAVRFVSPSLRPLRLSVLARRGMGSDLAQWTRLLLAGRRLERDGDWATTWGELRGRLGLKPSFLAEVADPMLASLWGVTNEQVLGLSARAALGPATPQQPTRQSDGQIPVAVAGGMGVWMEMIASHCRRLDLRLGTPVAAVEAGDGGRFRVVAGAAGGAGGAVDAEEAEYDCVVLAAPPWQVAEMAAGILPSEAVGALAGLPDTPALIGIHGDSTYLPAKPHERSGVSMVTGPGRSQLTTLAGDVRGRPLYRSWITWSDRQPDPLHATFEFRHVRPDPVLFEVQSRLAEWRSAVPGLHFAGSWVEGWDCQETAIRSGYMAAAAIDSSLARLTLLRG